MSGRPRRRRRRRDPIAASEAMARFRRRAGGPGASAVGELAAAWAEVVGAVAAAHSLPIRRSGAGVVSVACSSASWAQTLAARGDELAAGLAERCPGTRITRLRFSVADHVLAPPPAAPPRPTPPPAPGAAEQALGEQAAEPLAEPRLRELVARATAASAMRAKVSGKTKEPGKAGESASLRPSPGDNIQGHSRGGT